MNLSKHDPETEMEMDMTPMIDVVFLLIIFFILITDMSQADLEDLQLPVAQNADPDKPEKGEVRPVLNIKQDGSIWAKRENYFDPENSDGHEKLQKFLFLKANSMATEPLNEENPGGPMVPAGKLLIRADGNTLFKHVQKVMEICGIDTIKLWKLQLAAAEPAKDQPGGTEQ